MNANDLLREHTCSDNYYRYGKILVITDGVKALAEQFECFWFIDIIASYQPWLREEEFQVWTLNRNEDQSAIVLCTEGNGKKLKKQGIEFTDFKPTEATVWIERGGHCFHLNIDTRSFDHEPKQISSYTIQVRSRRLQNSDFFVESHKYSP